MSAAPGVQVTFLPGSPPRLGRVAMWRATGRPTPGASTFTAVVRAGEGVRRKDVEARVLPVGEAIDELLAIPPHAAPTASAAVWVAATHLALDLVARGRMLPAVTPDGFDAWRAGPLDATDFERREALADLFPPEAHCAAEGGSRRLLVPHPTDLLAEFTDAVADHLARSTVAVAATGDARFAAPAPVPVAELSGWLGDVATPASGGASIGLRLDLPDGPDGDIDAVLQLRSVADPSLVVDASKLWDAPAAVVERLGGDPEAELLLALRRGTRVWPPLGRLLDATRPERLRLSDDEAEALLGDGAMALSDAGIEVRWPTELVAGAVSLRAVASTPAPAAVAGSGLDLDAVLTVRYEALLDGSALTAQELEQLAEAKRPLVRLRGQWVVADPTVIERLRRPPRVRAGEVLAEALGGSGALERFDDDAPELVLDGWLAGLAAAVASVDQVTELAEPPGLEATLRHYQRRGLAWLDTMCELGLGGVLADDMGLGKTLQVVALHCRRHRDGGPAEGPTLVVCPTSLLANWEREINRFAPGVPVHRFHGGDRSLDGVGSRHIVLCTYGVLRRDRPRLAEVGWDLVVADEAQHVKNPLARTSRELRRVPAAARVALTGTPVENRLTDLWALIDWTTPGLLGPLDRFRRTVAVPVERDRDPEATERFAAVVRPFLLRRRKVDPGIAPELPPRTITDHVVPLTAEQATLYTATVRDALELIEEKHGMARRGLVLKLLTALKQICNHPAQYLAETGPLPGRSGKLTALDELIDVVVAEGASTLVFTQYVSMARLLDAHLSSRGIDTAVLHGGVSARNREAMVDRFQAGEFPVFILSIKAGGVGLNLTAATHVVHYDRWWNPAVEEQASDRAWRIGQDQPVQVHRLVCEGTLEDRIAELLERKRELADAVVGGGEGWITEMDDDALAALVELGS